MAHLRLFASAREAAGVREVELPGATVREVLDGAVATFGPAFAAVAATCAIWVNGEFAGVDHPVGEPDEVALLPPVSGG